MPIIIADSGPLVAILNSRDEHHAWARRIVAPLPRPWIVSTAALVETTHLLGNDQRALIALRGMLAGMEHETPDPSAVFSLMEKYAPTMDYADACAVLITRVHKGAVVVTTDHTDFSTYKIPFISPKGVFHG